MDVDLDQDNTDKVSADQTTKVVQTELAQGLSTLDCATVAGICNIKTQLTSKFFLEAIPNALDITGIARLGFGSAV